MEPLNLKEHLKSISQDAIIWKAKNIWKTAVNPDEESKAASDIVQMLFNIKNALKRDRYVSNIIENINFSIRRTEDQIKETERELDKISKLSGRSINAKEIARLEKKLASAKNPEVDEIKNIPHTIEELKLKDAEDQKSVQKQLDELNTALENYRLALRPKIKERDLKQYIKDKAKENQAIEKAKVLKKQQTKTHLSPEDIGLPIGFNGDFNAAVNFGIYEEDNCYFVRGSRGVWECVSSFTMKVHYLVRESMEASYRVITFKNSFGQERTLTVNTDDMTSVGSFKKIVNRLSNFSWQGKDEDLAKLNEYLQRDEKHAMQLNILGYNNRHKFWAWGNGILSLGSEVNFIPADEYGMVSTDEANTFYLPAANKLTGLTDDIDEITPEDKFCFTDTGVKFKDWAVLFQKAYGNNSTYAILWFISSLFRDVIFGNASIDRFPMLFLYGMPGTGKGAMAKSILSLLGYPQSSISLEANVSTAKGILRSFAQFKNGITWLDEYKNAIPKNLIALLKQLYDGASYSRAKKTNDVRTESSPINSSALVSGQDMPTIEAALLERFILIQFKEEKDRPAEVEKAFNDLKQHESEGLSSVAHDILRFRNIFTKTYMDHFRVSSKFMKTELRAHDVKERYQMNFAILLATFKTLKDLLTFPFDENQVKIALYEKAIEQSNLTKDNNDIAKFWNVIDFLVSQGLLVENKNFKFSHIKDKYCIVLKMRDAHPLYIKELRSRNDNFGLEEPTLVNYIKSDMALFVSHEKFSIGSQSVWAYALDYKELERRYNISLERKIFVPAAVDDQQYVKPFSQEQLKNMQHNPHEENPEIPFKES